MIHMLISDFPDLDTHLKPPTSNLTPDELGLIPFTSSDPASHITYFALHPDGSPRALIECTTPEATPRQSCTHQIRSRGLDVVLDYSAELLPRWEDAQTRVERFLGCATEE